MSRPGYIYIVTLPDGSIWAASSAKYVIRNAIKERKLLDYKVTRIRDYDHIFFRENPDQFNVDITEELKGLI